VSNENDRNVCSFFRIADDDAPGLIFHEFGRRQDRLEVTRFDAAVCLIHTLPVVVDKMPAKVSAREHRPPGSRARETRLTPASASAKDDRGEL
jgi:hypothetical protein